MIEVSGLTKTYGNKRGITDITFSIDEGEIVGFLGPNGAGKSTTMNVITGYLSATAGAARVAGIDILEDPLEAKKHIGYLPQDPPLYLDMTVDEYLNFIFDIKGVKGGSARPTSTRFVRWWASPMSGSVSSTTSPAATSSAWVWPRRWWEIRTC